jgi:signal transduction histidine kinase/CheY-like chemotaxis protein/HAMP domain-containing protein
MNKLLGKIKNRFTLWFLLVSLIPLLLAIAYIYHRQLDEIKRNNFHKLEAIRDLKVQSLTNWIAERSGDLIVISQDYDFTDLEIIADYDNPSVSDLAIIKRAKEVLQNYSRNYYDYEEIFILHPKTGKIVLSTKPHRDGIDKIDDEIYYAPILKRSLHIKDIHYSHENGNFVMAFSLPIFCRQHPERHVIGILGAVVNLDYSLFNLLQSNLGLGETGETLLVNKDLVALNRLRWNDEAPLKQKINTEIAQRAAGGETAVIKAKDYRGKEVLAAYTHIPETEWGFICKQDTSELKEAIQKWFFELILVSLLIAAAIVVISRILANRISQPIVKLKEMAHEIEIENYSARNTITSADEIGALAKSVNIMAEAIESHIKVQDCTSHIDNTLINIANLDEFATKMLKELMDITGSSMAAFYILNEDTNKFEHLDSIGANQSLLSSFDADHPEGEFGTAIAARRIYYFKSIPADTAFTYLTIAGNILPKEMITIPVLIDGRAHALFSLSSIYEFSSEALDALNLSWNAINQSYSNILHAKKVRIQADELAEQNKKLSAQKEELQQQAEELQQQAEELQQSSQELRQQNLELEAQKVEVMQANSLKSEFLSNMSHELRTPLNSVIALSDILVQRTHDRLDQEEIDYLSIIQRNGKRLLEQINDILDLSKIEAGRIDLVCSMVAPDTLIDNICQLLKPLAEPKGLELKLDFPEKLPKIYTDEKRLQQILQNIIANAIKYTHEGYVHIFGQIENDKLYIHIEDTGIGIPKDKIYVIFDEFRQVDGSTSRMYEGSGLGLAISRKLVKLLDGEITVTSELGKGSTFTVILPLKMDYHEMSPRQGEYCCHDLDNNESHATQTQRLLLVEDNEAAIIQVRSLLQRNGYLVDIATNGREALDYVKHTLPDAVILDLMMPEIDGFEVLEKIRQSQKTRNLPVLILTAKDLDQNDLARLSSNNIQQLVHKGDIDSEGLLLKVKLMLNTKSQNKSSQLMPPPSPSHQGKPKIIIIEDNPDNMITLKAVVKDKYDVIEALDGLSGLQLILAKKPQLILLDINLPQISGIELISILKNAEDTKNIPIIAVTARVLKRDEIELIEAGCDDYMAKPVQPAALLEKINNLLEK